MDGFLKAIIDKLPGWSFHAFAVMIAIGIGLYFYKTFFLQKKFNQLVEDVLKRDDRIKEFQQKIDFLSAEKNKKEIIASQVTSTIANVSQFVEALNNLRRLDSPQLIFRESTNLLIRILNVLSSDIKSASGGRHRCGIWLRTDHVLVLNFTSAGFPISYNGHRQLHMDRSIAGRCLRKQSVIICPDVTKDEDYEKNEDSKSPYKSLICIPFENWGVLTIDGLEPMSDECRLIGELYATIIQGIMDEYVKALVHQQNQEHIMKEGEVI